jgi:hypothetical protein
VWVVNAYSWGTIDQLLMFSAPETVFAFVPIAAVIGFNLQA